jgi:hypothetical protein
MKTHSEKNNNNNSSHLLRACYAWGVVQKLALVAFSHYSRRRPTIVIIFILWKTAIQVGSVA